MGGVVSKGLVFQPPIRQPETPQRRRRDEMTFWLRTRRGSSIEAAYVDRGAEFTVLFSHANAEDVHMIYPWLRDLAKTCGVNAMCYSYTGYGRSVGTPSEADVYADADAAWDFLVIQKRCDPRKIFLYGRSIGSGPATYLAERLSLRRTPPGGLILQSPVLSVFRIALNFRVTVPGDMFPNVDRVRNVACPVFVVHGEKDEVVPLWHGEGLWLATPITWRYKPFWIPDAGHNNIELLLRDSGELFKRLSDFFTHCANPDIQRKQTDFYKRRDVILFQQNRKRKHRRSRRLTKRTTLGTLVLSCTHCGGDRVSSQKFCQDDDDDDDDDDRPSEDDLLAHQYRRRLDTSSTYTPIVAATMLPEDKSN